MLYSQQSNNLLSNKRKAVYYPPSGTGRDSYIMIDNGGTNSKYSPQGTPQLGNYMKFGPITKSYRPGSSTRFQKYLTDGSGRDKYIVFHQGGQYRQDEQVGSQLLKFCNSMRDRSVWRGNQTSSQWKPNKSVVKEDELRRTQRSISVRLSNPKRETKKYEAELKALRRSYFLSLNGFQEGKVLDKERENPEI